MSTRSQSLAEQFEQVNGQVIAAVEACGETAWRATSPNEGWPVAFSARHIGDGHTGLMGAISLVANGQPPPALTPAMLDAQNAANATRYGECTKQEALALLRQNGTAVADAIRRLSDEQLDRTAVFEHFFDGATVSVQQLIERALVGHTRRHLAGMLAAV